MLDTATAVQMRWMIRRDLDQVMAIENQSFEFPWTEDELLKTLRDRNVIPMVAEWQERVVAFMIYELQKHSLHVLTFAVDPLEQRHGIGRLMVKKLVNKLSQHRRTEIVLEVREKNLPAQLFFRSMGFKAIGVLFGHYEDTDEDAYQMRYVLPLCD